MKTNIDDTIAAISTPAGEGGIGIVRLSGKRALEILDGIFISKDKKSPSQYETYTIHYGWIVDGGHRRIDEVILTVMRGPKSFTKEDVIEINCHGGIVALKKVLELTIRRGARIAEPGEFTMRAFMNGRIDLAQAESVLDIVKAKTDSSLRVALNQLEGRLSNKVNKIRDDILEILTHVEAGIDFPDEDIEIITEERLLEKTDRIIWDLKRLIETADEGIILREGLSIVICGKPNVGKSSLMNLLLKRDRVIVTPQPGTTRDAVEEMINLRGIPVRLADTAGMVQTEDAVEKEGVGKSKEYLEKANLALFMLDGSTPIESKDLDIAGLINRMEKKALGVINKVDLPQQISERDVRFALKCENVVKISIPENLGINVLEDALLDMIWSGKVSQNEGSIVTNTRHKRALEKSYESTVSARRSLEEGKSLELVSIDVKEAIYHLGLIMGKSVSEDVLDRIFEQFCIGK